MSDPGEWLTAMLCTLEAFAKSADDTDPVWEPLAGSVYEDDDDVADFVATFDPPMMIRLIAGAREMLKLHERETLEVVVHRGIGKPLGKRTRLACSHCDDGYQQLMDWPCPTVEVLAQGWGWPGDTKS